MKTILSFIDWYLPGYRAGGTLKAFANQVAHLEGTYNFMIITRDTDYCETEPYPNVESNAWNDIAPNAAVFYVSTENLNIGFLRRLVHETDFDAVFIHGVYSFYFSILPVLLTRSRKVKTVISAHGMLGNHSLSVKSNKKKSFLKLVKLGGFYRNVVFHAANIAEAQDVKKVLGNDIKVMIAEELPMKISLSEWKPRQKEINVLKLCSVARISPEKNTLYALERLAEVKNVRVSYDIFGPVYNEEYWSECKKVIERMPENVTIRYMGSLQGDKVLETLGLYHAMFMPTNGENFGHTILESFMAATPVIISQNTPWQALESAKSGWDLPLQEPESFVDTIGKLAAMNQTTFDQWSESAQRFAERFMKNNSILEQNIKLFEDER